MNYTPRDLKNVSFKTELLYGYNREQVKCMMDKIYQDYVMLQEKNEKLQTNIEIMEETVKHYKTIEESLQHTLVIAQKTSENMNLNACEKANKIIKDAEEAGQRVIQEANQKVEDIKREYEELKKYVNAYRVRSQTLLLSTLEMIKAPFEESNE